MSRIIQLNESYPMHGSLTYEFEKMEVIIKSLLVPSPGMQPMLFEDEGKPRETLLQEIDRIKNSFIREVFAFDDEHHLQRYIHFHQQELIRILDQLQVAGQQPAWRNSTRESNSQFVMRNLDDLLSFIETHFTRYFDQDTKAPESYIALTGSEVVINLSALQEELRKNDTEIQLISLVLTPLRRFVERIPAGKITYREIMYCKEVNRELRKIIDSANQEKSFSESIRSLFLYLNYNTVTYFNYYTLYLNMQMKKMDATPQKIEHLSFLLKSIKQTQIKQGVGFNHHKQNIREQLIDWLSEEMTHLERSLQLTQKNLHTAGPLPADFKIQTDMSLSQLAYLMRIFVDTKIIQNKNLSDVLRFVSRAFQVKNQNILYESFRVRYYNPEESIRKSVRSMLLQLVDYINKT